MNSSNIEIRNSIPRPCVRRVIVLVAVGLACFAFPLSVRAVDPAPDGGYSGNNTAEGTDALYSLTGGAGNTALGFDTLYNNTTGYSNTATGTNALREIGRASCRERV